MSVCFKVVGRWCVLHRKRKKEEKRTTQKTKRQNSICHILLHKKRINHPFLPFFFFFSGSLATGAGGSRL